MKKILSLIIITACMASFFAGCKDDEVSPAFMVATGLIVAPADSSTTTFAVASSNGQPWTVVAKHPWCTVSPATGTGDAMVQVMISPNTIAVERMDTLTITSGSGNTEIRVKQSGATPLMTFSFTDSTITDAADTVKTFIAANGPWTADVNAEAAGWCSLSAKPWKGLNTIDTLDLVYKSNGTTSQRIAAVTLTLAGITKKITLTQNVGDLVLKVTPGSFNIKQTASNFPLNISVAGTWTAEVDAASSSWCSLNATSGDGRSVITITADALTGDDQRKATITVTSDTMVELVTITQAHYFTDTRDGKSYKMVKMPDGNWWMAENLRYINSLVYNEYSNMANGATISNPTQQTPAGFTYLAIGSYWCNGRNESNPASSGPYNDNTIVCATYGALYTWETAMMLNGKWSDDTQTSSTWDETWTVPNRVPTTSASSACTVSNARGMNNQGIAPPGWHIPTDAEWATMLDMVDGNGAGTAYRDQSGPISGDPTPTSSVDAGKKLKTANTCSSGNNCNTNFNAVWDYHAANFGTDIYGFGAIPAGYRTNTVFSSRGNKVYYWTSSVSSTSTVSPYSRSFLYNSAKVGRSSTPSRNGAYVRCVKNQ